MSLRPFVLDLETLPFIVVFLALCMAVLLILERHRPAAAKPRNPTLSPSARLGGNLTLGAFNAAVWIAITFPVTAIAIAQATEQGFFDWRGSWATGWTGLFVDIVLLDLGAYFWHRASHEVPLLWRFHEVHHRDEFLDSTTGLRFHFGELLLGSAFRAVLVCGIASPLEHVIVFDALVLLMGWVGHSNIRLPAWFGSAVPAWLATPSYHRVHHRAIHPESEQNYAVIFTLWDRVFGTRAQPGRRSEELIGVRHASDLPLPDLLGLPFHKRE